MHAASAELRDSPPLAPARRRDGARRLRSPQRATPPLHAGRRRELPLWRTSMNTKHHASRPCCTTRHEGGGPAGQKSRLSGQPRPHPQHRERHLSHPSTRPKPEGQVDEEATRCTQTTRCITRRAARTRPAGEISFWLPHIGCRSLPLRPHRASPCLASCGLPARGSAPPSVSDVPWFGRAM